MNRLVELIANCLGYTGEIEHKPARMSDVTRLIASSARAKELLGFTTQISFEEGIQKTLDWYVQQRGRTNQ